MTDTPLSGRTLFTPDRWTLATQFAVAGGVVMTLAMIAVGIWVSARIEESVVRNTANATAQYMESFISPISQDLERSNQLSPLAHQALDEVFLNTPLGERVLSYKIWKEGGLVVDASDPAIIGKKFDVSDDLRRAWKGEVAASFDELSAEENSNEGQMGKPLLEIYSPIRAVWSGKVIGVVEFYELATTLSDDLAQARRRSWATVALVLGTIGLLLYVIVLRGSRTIDRQRNALTVQLDALRQMSDHNATLRLRVQEAAARSSAMNDQSLRQIGADLHDGPAQLMAYAALRLDSLRNLLQGQKAKDELEQIDRAVKDAIREVRSISRGLSLPDIDARSVTQILSSVVDAHKARTGTAVVMQINETDLPPLSAAIKICFFRFVQEGLNNAWRYGEGKDQQVSLTVQSGRVTLTVSDSGPGYPDAIQPSDDHSGMGLSGLRDRVESLGGTFEIYTRRDAMGTPLGATLSMTLDVGRTI